MNRFAAIALALLVLGCARQAPVGRDIDRARNLTVAPAVAEERLRSEMQTLGLTLAGDTGSGGLVRGTTSSSDGRDWYDCPAIRVRDQNGDRIRLAKAESVSVQVVARVTSLATTNVSIETNFLGRYRNSFTNTPFSGRCGSTGRLEKALLDAAAGSSGAA